MNKNRIHKEMNKGSMLQDNKWTRTIVIKWIINNNKWWINTFPILKIWTKWMSPNFKVCCWICFRPMVQIFCKEAHKDNILLISLEDTNLQISDLIKCISLDTLNSINRDHLHRDTDLSLHKTKIQILIKISLKNPKKKIKFKVLNLKANLNLTKWYKIRWDPTSQQDIPHLFHLQTKHRKICVSSTSPTQS